ncbi:MAG TPA: nicotinate (nicotinamide) nucleotide adenylyltransferase [Tepidisphaeraceae bacterium]|jgi:nicotinate-nucleotide adenylyltransferase
MQRLYFGGSFNPPHLAHIRCCAAAAVAIGLGGVVLVPTGRSALKDEADIAPAADRLAMTRLAAAAADAAVPFDVDDLEITRTGTSYTVDTVTALRAKGVSPVHWLIGADQLLNLHRWHRVEALLQLAHFHVMCRPGYEINWTTLDARVRALQRNVVAVPQMDISGTDIRRRLRAAQSIEGRVAPSVREYLLDRRLYIQ